MADIRELGESLLARAKANNKERYKRSRNEGYKIAALTAGVGLMNEAVKQNAVQFMQSEDVLAQKAKYRAAVSRAGNIASMNETIQATGKTPEQYFYDTRYLPSMQEEFKNRFGQPYVPESYMPMLTEKARELARADAEEFQQAYDLATRLPDMETAMTEFNSLVMPPVSLGGKLAERVKGFFTGRKEEDFRADAIKRVSEQGLIKDENIKNIFDKVANTHGLDEAVKFVKGLDASGFNKRPNVMEYSTEILSSDNGAKFTIVTEAVEKDPVTGNPVNKPTYITKQIDGYKSPEAVKDVESALVEKLDIRGWASKMLNGDGLAELNKRVSDAGLSLTAQTSVEDALKVGRIVDDLGKNASYIKDDVAKQAYADIMSAVLSSGEFMLQGIMTDANEKASAAGTDQERLAIRLKALSDLAANISKATSSGFNTDLYPVKDRTPGPVSVPIDTNVIDGKDWDWTSTIPLKPR